MTGLPSYLNASALLPLGYERGSLLRLIVALRVEPSAAPIDLRRLRNQVPTVGGLTR